MHGYALLFCNGEPPKGAFAKKLAAGASFIAAADGGANIARSCGVVPHLVVGDLDSVKSSTLTWFTSRRRPRTEVVHLTRQDNTDLEKALDLFLEWGVTRALLLGATGRRLDHTLGNLSVIWNYTQRIAITVAGDDWTALPIGTLKQVRAKRGTIVSIIPFGACSGVTLAGLRYPLTDAEMPVGSIGLSNVVVRSPFSIRVREGNLLMVVQADLFSLRILSS